jgi:hypothetical protein
MSQTSYSIEHAGAYEGGRATSGPCVAVAGLNKQGAEVKFGRFVALVPGGSNANLTGLKPNDYVPFGLLAGGASKILGVLIHDMAHEDTIPQGVQGVADGKMGSILKQGTIYVKAEVAMLPGDPVFVRHTANGGNTDLGLIRNDADTANAVQVTQAEVMGTRDANGLVAIRINLP